MSCFIKLNSKYNDTKIKYPVYEIEIIPIRM